ncbi:MAG TPA: response regulator transcription factor [Chitinophagaceae bacterium]
MNKPGKKILFIEDELSLAEIIKETLESRGFQVTHHSTGLKGLESYQHENPDIILLDINLPDTDGYIFARHIRTLDPSVPIVFLTSRQLPQDVVTGFESGGNDYLKKPFSMEELIIRIRVLLTRHRNLLLDTRAEHNISEIGNFIFDYDRGFLQLNEKKIKLTARESDLLKILLLNRNQVLERKTILDHLWGNDDFFSGRSLDVFITKLRKYFKADPSVQIANIRGIGYKLVY